MPQQVTTMADLETLIEAKALKTFQAEGVKLEELMMPKFREALQKSIQEHLEPINNKLFGKGEGAEDKLEKTGGFANIADFALDVYRAGHDGRHATDRLMGWDKKCRTVEKHINKAAGTGMLEGSEEYGGYLIPTEFRNELLKVALDSSQFLKRCRMIPMQSNQVDIPMIRGFDRSGGTVHGGIAFVWVNELTQGSDKRPTFGKIKLELKKALALAPVSEEMLEDSPMTIEPMLKEMFAEAMGWEMDYQILNGTGAGRPLGILNAPALIGVSKETGQLATTLRFENICKMYARLYPKQGAIAIANDDCFSQLAAMSLTVGTGGAPVWLPAGGISVNPFNSIMGKELVYSEHAQTLGAQGDFYFANFNEYLVGHKAGAGLGMKFSSSIHLKFDYDQMTFKISFRVDGQPWWPSALTPRHSSATLSPFTSTLVRS